MLQTLSVHVNIQFVKQVEDSCDSLAGPQSSLLTYMMQCANSVVDVQMF